MHSFTPSFKGESRAMQVGMLYNKDARLAHILLDLLRQEGDLVVGDNAPYAVTEDSDYGVPTHGEKRGLAHVEIEIRQDLIATPDGQQAWAHRFARLLTAADAALKAGTDAADRSCVAADVSRTWRTGAGAARPTSRRRRQMAAGNRHPGARNGQNAAHDAGRGAGFIEALATHNPAPETEFSFTDPFTLLVAVVLSAQATDLSVNRATETLFKVAPTPKAMIALGVDGVASHIRSIGLWQTKARNVVHLPATWRTSTAARFRTTARRWRRCPGSAARPPTWC